MSTPFYDLASLVLVPSGYKAQKVYAQKPLTTDGQLSFSRASTATRVNSAGLIEAVSSNVPRLDYQGSTCPKLLLEPQRTNAILWSEQINTTNWPSSSQINATANALVSPDGTQNADVIIPNTTNANHGPAQNVSGLTSGATYSCSIYAKAQGYSKFLILAGAGTGSGQYEFDLTAGTAQAGATITSVGNGWYRCTAPLVPNSSLLQYLIFISNGSAYSYAGNGTNGIAFWGAQLEAGAYATSYIPTLGTSVTRVADAASKTSASALIGQTEGTVFWEIQVDTPSATAHETFINVDGGSFGNTVYIYKTSAAGFIAEMYNSGVLQARFVKSGVTVGVHKLAIGYANNDTALFVDGVQVGTTDTSCTTPAMSRIQLGQNVFGASTDRTAQVLLFKTRLTNAQLAELTTL